MTTARELRRCDSNRRITMVSADDAEGYYKPNLSIAFGRRKDAESLVSTSAREFAEQFDVAVCPRTTVHSIQPTSATIETSEGQIEYESLVLAVGARPRSLRIDGVASERIFGVNSLDEYRRLRRELSASCRVLIVGAGFVGCELANDLCLGGFSVDVVDPASRPLAYLWPPALSRQFEHRMASAGVRWHLDTQVVEIREDRPDIVATLTDGANLRADVAVSAVGLVPQTALASAAGLSVGHGICVSAELATSARQVYAIGDCAEVDGEVRPFVLPIIYSARALARTLAGNPTRVLFPPIPVTLKTPACPATFFPRNRRSQGDWTLLSNDAAVFEGPDGVSHGVALVGHAAKLREEWVKRLSANVREFGDAGHAATAI